MQDDSNEVSTAIQPTREARPAIILETPANATAAEAVKFDLGMARHHGALTLAYLARAGWRLACEKQGTAHGRWMDLCKGVGISDETARKYISFYYSTVGERLRAQGVAHRLVEDLTDAMIEEATAGLESKTATGAMIELGIVKRPAGWGGEREGAGRKAALPKLSASAEAEHVWAELMMQLDKTVVMDTIPLLGEKSAAVCLDRIEVLARALRQQVRDLKGMGS
jgi:hypothetical protein